ncbi:hypothetical protein [Vibrio neptunius]|uniref:hypothetical protein n=1 Tax=Vibrio neptunius TaxID=170651 RepID=UPI000698C471|nr:hypothetical protein [Vibrio neptunius]
MKSIYVILVLFQLIFMKSSLAFEDKYFHANFENSSFIIKSNPIENDLFIYKENSLFVKASNFTIDGYSVFKEIKTTSDGFIITNRGNDFSGQFDIYIKYESGRFIITKTKSYISYVSDGIFLVTKTCQKDTNILLEDAMVSDLEPFLSVEGNKSFNDYCHVDVDSDYGLSEIERKFSQKEVVISQNILRLLITLYPIKKENQVYYNNIAYYISKAGHHQSSIDILEDLIAIVPNRTVAYLNLADSYQALKKNKLAKKNYQMYYELMKKNNRSNKIPERVYIYLKIDHLKDSIVERPLSSKIAVSHSKPVYRSVENQLWINDTLYTGILDVSHISSVNLFDFQGKPALDVTNSNGRNANLTFHPMYPDKINCIYNNSKNKFNGLLNRNAICGLKLDMRYALDSYSYLISEVSREEEDYTLPRTADGQVKQPLSITIVKYRDGDNYVSINYSSLGNLMAAKPTLKATINGRSVESQNYYILYNTQSILTSFIYFSEQKGSWEQVELPPLHQIERQ